LTLVSEDCVSLNGRRATNCARGRTGKANRRLHPIHLLIAHPPSFEAERRYVFDVVFRQWLGLEYDCRAEGRDDTSIRVPHVDAQGELLLSDCFFRRAGADWLRESSLPATPLQTWDDPVRFSEFAVVADHGLPVLYGERLGNGEFLAARDDRIWCGVDLLGGVFFLLSRYEEVVRAASVDAVGRFSLVEALAYREAFLLRPLADEYVGILLAAMRRLWPTLRTRAPHWTVKLTHDIDFPFSVVGKPAMVALRRAACDLVLRRSPGIAFQRLLAWVSRGERQIRLDPVNTFDFLMDVSEANGLQSAFYFKADCTNRRFDEHYDLAAIPLRQILRRICERGHEIGLHPSYESFADRTQIGHEFSHLRRIAEEEGARQETWGGRQHYLRWVAPTTWQYWEDVGLDYDSSVGFAGHVGFRCGTCRRFSVFNVVDRRPLRLIERPLLVMDGSLFDSDCMNLSEECAHSVISGLARQCRIFGGDLVLLWHNSRVVSARQKAFYRRMVAHVCG
jgi:hypothetical protein